MPREAVYTLRVDTRQAQADWRRFMAQMQRETQVATRNMGGSAGRSVAGGASNPAAALASMRAMTTAVTGFVAATGLVQGVRMVTQLADMGTEARRTAAAFEYISGGAQDAAANLAAIERASQGTLSTLDAQRIA
ncbi:MAG: hypothetical protein KDE20_27045, partial [Caldilineaceae bacterium]|nr:hypothetical protein [Caldilineaceae bacterium]